MKKSSFVFVVVALISWGSASSQTIEVPFDSDQWETKGANYVLQKYEGRDAILLQAGTIYLKDVAFLDGTIEVDINFSALRNFPGIGWRMVDPENHEHFYIRPHQSGNADANQYTPVFNGLAGWQLYHGELYATPVHYTFNEWHHVRIEVAGSQAKIFFDDMEKPLLEVKELLRSPQSGTLSLNTRTNVHFANFKYTPAPTSAPISLASPRSLKPELDGLITSWQLSDKLNTKTFQEKNAMTSTDLKDVRWVQRNVESSGVLNIGRYTKLERDHNSVLVKLDIQADSKQIKQLVFGYSDLVKVFINGQAVYSGSNIFRSRDYRYLGTIGYFDSIYLPLRKGKNEVIFLVTENFGGWGLQAILKDRKGIHLP